MQLPLREFVSPLPLAAMTIMAVNDHALKWIFASWWTGKLSDVAGLIYFPLLLTASFNTARTLPRWGWCMARGIERPWPVARLRRGQLLVAVVLTGGVFSAIKLSGTAMGWYLDGLRQLQHTGLIGPSRAVVDPTDLLALPALALSWWWGCRYLEAE